MNNSSTNLKRNLDDPLTLDESQNILVSCCGGKRTDRRLIVISTQIALSFVTIIFAFFMLAGSLKEDQIYTALLSSILSFWLGKSSDF